MVDKRLITTSQHPISAVPEDGCPPAGKSQRRRSWRSTGRDSAPALYHCILLSLPKRQRQVTRVQFAHVMSGTKSVKWL